MCDCKFFKIKTNSIPHGDSYIFGQDGICAIKENRGENFRTIIGIDTTFKEITGLNGTGLDCNFAVNKNVSCSDCPAYEKV
jgi:hypothetical protein